jgi:hypothetical protein
MICRMSYVIIGVIVVVIVWLLDLQLTVQSVSITTKVVSSNLVHDGVYSMLATTCAISAYHH